MVRKMISLSTAFFLFCSTTSYAVDLSNGLTLSKDLSLTAGGKGNEYVSGDYPGAVLMKVNLWGAVGKSGIHYVPARTDLITLLSYAGGPNPNANLSDVFIKRWSNGEEKIIKVDAEKIIASSGIESPSLEAHDIVVVPTKAPLISADTAVFIGILTSVISIAFGAILLSR